ncbi:MAG: nucleoside-diphosphate kinase [Candidatus Falkowbacteria bacterium]|nr:nucleoside-diphosphate kinase [Candidatus Falkowbacteria bacterium]
MTHPKKERTLVILKPDAVQRGLIGDLLKRFENTGLKLVAMKMIVPKEEIVWQHYNKDDVWFQAKGEKLVENLKASGRPVEKAAIEYGKDIIGALVKFMTASPVVPMIWEGNQSVAIIKKLVGGTEPATSDVGTIRGDYTLDSYEIANLDDRAVRNLVHCTDNPDESEREIALWFNNEEIINYRLIAEQMLYDVNLDGLLE